MSAAGSLASAGLGSNERNNGVRLLSLDGGGIRGLSELLILERLMSHIQRNRVPAHGEELKPCQVFDMICGTSTGGLIAIMLGRLRMTVGQCIEAYAGLAKEVFGDPVTRFRPTDPRFKASVLKAAIEKIVTKQRQGEQMFDDSHNSCKTFVCAIPTASVTRARRLRTYDGSPSAQCTIWQAALATSAAPTFFEIAEIQFRNGITEKFIDGAMGCNNPVLELYSEAREVFPNREVACIVSIGTGSAPVSGLPKPTFLDKLIPKNIISALKTISTNCERFHDLMFEQFRDNPDIYFRFNVAAGLESIGLGEWERLGDVQGITTHYIEGSARRNLITAAAVIQQSNQGTATKVRASLARSQYGDATPSHDIEEQNCIDGSDISSIKETYRQAQDTAYITQELLFDFPKQELLLRMLNVDPVTMFNVRKDKASRHQGTCEWIHQKDVFENWRYDIGPQILILVAPPGRGKSTLAKYILQELRTDNISNEDIVVLEFFCHESYGRNSHAAILQSLLFQLLDERRYLFERGFQKFGRSLEKLQDLPLTVIWEILLDVLDSLRIKSIYWIIDGLDECEEKSQRSFWESVQNSFNFESSGKSIYATKIHILITSRPTALAKEIGLLTHEIEIRREDVELDIAHYVDHRVKQMTSTFLIPADLSADVTRLLGERAEGMFLWATLSLDQLRDFEDGLSSYNITEVFNEVPKDVIGLYERAVRRIAEHPKRLSYAQKIFSVLIFAGDSLSVEAFASIMSMWSLECKSQAEVEKRRDLRFEYTVKQTCGSLIRISDGVIQLCHPSAQKFLIQEASGLQLFSFDEDQCHTHLAKICLRYLMMVDFESQPTAEFLDNLHFSLVSYALRNWPIHLRSVKAGINGLIPDLQNFFTASNIRRLWRCLRIWRSFSIRFDQTWSTSKGVIIHALAFHRLPNVLNILKLSDGMSDSISISSQSNCHAFEIESIVDAANEYQETPLMIATAFGDAETVKLLFELGASIDKVDEENYSVLHHATHSSNLELVKYLMSKTRKINSKSKNGYTPLTLARDTAVIELLLDNGANVNSTTDDEWDALSLAIERENADAVQLLLERGADIDSVSLFGRTPLSIAAQSGNSVIFQKILQHGPRIISDPERGWNAMHIAASTNFLDAVILLIQFGVDVNVRTRQGSTPLFLASSKGHEDVAEILLHRQCDVNATDFWGRTALFQAVEIGNMVLAQKLINAGPEINIVSKEGISAVRMASERGNLAMVQLLVRHGAKLDFIPDDNEPRLILHQNNSPLLVAVINDHLDVARFLIQEGADVNCCSRSGLSLLHEAAFCGSEEFIQELLQLGLNVNAVTRYQWTPLHEVAETGNVQVAKLLVDAGSSLESCTNMGKTPLHICSANGHLDLLKYFLDHVGTLEEPKKNHHDMLTLAAYNGHRHVLNFLLVNNKISKERLKVPFLRAAEEDRLEVVRLFFDTGVDINCTDDFGRSAMLLAMNRNAIQVVEFLIDQGASVSTPSNDGTFVLHHAARHGADRVVEHCLANGGGNPLSVAVPGWTPLALAASQDHPGTVGLLLAHVNGDLGDFDDYCSPLDHACRQGSLEIVRLLISRGCDPKELGFLGRSTVQAASHFRKVDVLEFLISQGVDVTLSDSFGFTPLHIASRFGHVDVLRFLINRGVPLDAQNESGDTAISIAISYRWFDCVKFLSKAGADPTLLNCLGFTAMDLASTLPLASEALKDWRSRYQPISQEQRQRIQTITIRSHLTRLLDLYSDDSEDRNWAIHHVWMGLVRLKIYELAREVILLASLTLYHLYHPFQLLCYNCSNEIIIYKEVLRICETCVLSICEACHETGGKPVTGEGRLCSHKGLLSISKTDWDEMEPAFKVTPDKETIGWQRWLNKMCREFDVNLPSETPKIEDLIFKDKKLVYQE